MTIKELYNDAVKKGIENYNIEVQYRDDGGSYPGTESIDADYIEVNNEKQIVIL